MIGVNKIIHLWRKWLGGSSPPPVILECGEIGSEQTKANAYLLKK